MGRVELAGRTVRRLGISAAGLKVTGMWGEPASRRAAVAAVRRAVELGAEVVEVPFPFGPSADLVREAGALDLFIVLRLTGPLGDLDAARRRLGRPADLVVADRRLLPGLPWSGPVGVVIGPGDDALSDARRAAVRGPFPAPPGELEWCEQHRVPYLADSVEILTAGAHTIAVPAPANVTEVERLFAAGPPTPPAAGPG